MSSFFNPSNPPCTACNIPVNADCRCRICFCNLHTFCSVEPNEGHGAIYLCPKCAAGIAAERSSSVGIPATATPKLTTTMAGRQAAPLIMRGRQNRKST
jgi:hypothetical protein